MSAKHTPGPWEVMRNRHPNLRGESWGWVSPDASNYGLPGISMSWDGKQGLANARLIAAAPDLLTALTAYADWMSASYDDIAEQFYREAGIMAPGKSQPLGYDDGIDDTERSKRFSAWITERKAALSKSARAAIARATGGEP